MDETELAVREALNNKLDRLATALETATVVMQQVAGLSGPNLPE